MRLTLALLKRKMPHGNIWLGKDRMHHRIFPKTVSQFEKRLQVEERNMFLLRHPYLTPEVERGHARELQLQKIRLARIKIEKACYDVQHSVRSEDRLSHLLVASKWEL